MAFQVCILFSISLQEYWLYNYGSQYYLGAYSDDYQYEVVWGQTYFEKHGINPFELQNELGDTHNSIGYVYLIVFLKFLTSEFGKFSTLTPIFINIFFLIYIANKVFSIVERYSKSKRTAEIPYQKVIFSCAFFPVMLFNSAHVFRDTIVAALLINFYEKTTSNLGKLKKLWTIFLTVFLLFYFRKSTLVPLLSLCPLLLFIKDSKSLKVTILLIFGPLLTVILFNTLAYDLLLLSNKYYYINQERLGTIATKLFELPLIIGIIPRIIYLIFTPVPNLTSWHQMFISISAILQIVCFPFLIKGLLNKNIDIRLKITFLSFLVGIASTTATFRHVNMYIPFGISIVWCQILGTKTNKLTKNGYILYQLLLFSILLLILLYATV